MARCHWICCNLSTDGFNRGVKYLLSRELFYIVDQISREKGIEREALIEAMKSAVVLASKKRFGSAVNMKVNFSDKTGKIELFFAKEVSEKVADARIQISLSEALAIDPKAQIGQAIDVAVEIGDFGRIAAQAAKQVIIQKVREAERDLVYKEYKDFQGELLNALVHRVEKGNIILDLGKAEALLPRKEQNFRENFRRGDRIRVYVLEVKKDAKGQQVVVSRTHPGLLVKLFEMEVPEISEGIVEIKGVVREASGRSKIAVSSKNKDVDPVGACVGARGARVQAVVQELRGEKIDIIEWTEDAAQFVRNALSPARVIDVKTDAKNKSMEVIIPDDQLSLAIGKKGQNVRLAAKLTGWKIDIKRESEQRQAVASSEDAAQMAFDHLSSPLSAIPEIEGRLSELLHKSGYHTIKDLLEAPLESLKSIEGVGEEAAQKLKSFAAAISEAGAGKEKSQGQEKPS